MIKFLNSLEELRRMTSISKKINKASKVEEINDKVKVLFVKKEELDSKDRYDHVEEQLDDLIRMINTPKEDLPKAREIFEYFNSLSECIIYASLNNRETYQVIEYFINRNIYSGIRENGFSIRMDKLKKMKFETIDTEELISLIKERKLNEFINRDEEELSEKEKAQIEEVKRRFLDFSVNIDELAKNNLRFKESIIDKLPNITLEDIVDGLSALKSLECADEIIGKIKMHLLSVYEKNLNQSSEKIDDLELNDIYIDMLIPVNVDKDNNIIKDDMYSHNNRLKKLIRSHNEALNIKSSTPQPTLKTKKYLTESEVNKLNEYLCIFYGIYNNKIRKIPTFDEIFKVVDCMEKLGEDRLSIGKYLTNILDFINNQDNEQEDYVHSKEELVQLASLFIKYKVKNDDIYAFIRSYSGKFIKTYDNPIDEYLGRLEEISFYDKSLKKDMDELYEMALDTDEDDYKEIETLMGEYLDLVNEISDVVSYQYNLAYKLNQV